MNPKKMTNAKFAEENVDFIEACKKATKETGIEIKPTTRQASKYRNKKGLAYKRRKGE